jgi:hypothetical protein
MRSLLVVAVLLGWSLSVLAADFRGASWGMTVDQVKKTEKIHLDSEENSQLVYSTVISGQPTLVTYYFSNGSLSSASYRFTKDHRLTEEYVDDYKSLQSQLEKKYGAPTSNNRYCDDAFYSEYPERWGTAVVVGKMRFLSVWNGTRLTVTHGMRALPGGTVEHDVEYSPTIAPKNAFGSQELLGAL